MRRNNGETSDIIRTDSIDNCIVFHDAHADNLCLSVHWNRTLCPRFPDNR